MPGHYGYAAPGAQEATAAGQSLRHHPDHAILPAFEDSNIAAGLVLRRAGLAGGFTGGVWTGPDGTRVWLDGEAFDDDGPLPPEETAARLARQGGPEILDGAFAAVIHDPRARTLRFITDPCGLKYLYLRADANPAWCGELAGFLRLPGAQPHLNPDCVRDVLAHGHPLGDTTWFRGVELLGPGIEAVFDLGARTWTRRRYVRFDDVAPRADAGRRERERATADIAALWRRAVERRAAPPQTPTRAGSEARIGLTLSGGLDSRAILAALKTSEPPPETLTFGIPGCADARLAARAAAVRGAPHTFLPLGHDDDWLAARAPFVPLTDGSMSILDVHGMESLPEMEARMDVCLQGFLGDALLGGGYLERPGFSAADHYLHRGRRLILQSLHYGGTRLAYRMPFLDLRLVRATLALPEKWRRDSRLYRDMLLREFPAYFAEIPWEKTGLPLSAPRWRETAQRLASRIRARLGDTSGGYADYPRWLRAPAAREYLESRLQRDALVYRFVSADDTADRMRRHARGENHAVVLGRRLTLELWLRFLRDGGLALP